MPNRPYLLLPQNPCPPVLNSHTAVPSTLHTEAGSNRIGPISLQSNIDLCTLSPALSTSQSQPSRFETYSKTGDVSDGTENVLTKAASKSFPVKNLESEALSDSGRHSRYTSDEDESSQTAAMQIFVRRSTLSNALGSGLNKLGFFSKLKNLFKKRVLVEATPHGRFDSLFYAPFPKSTERSSIELSVSGRPSVSEKRIEKSFRPEKVRFLTAGYPPTDGDNLVRIGDSFDISVVGMSVTPQDTFAHSFNELLLFSEHKADHEEAEELAEAGFFEAFDGSSGYTFGRHTKTTLSNQKRKATKHNGHQEKNRQKPVNSYYYSQKLVEKDEVSSLPILQSGEVPKIHFDPLGDGYTAETLPDTFVSIPASRARVLRRCAVSRPNKADNEPEDCDACKETRACRGVSLKFTVLEIDRVTQAQVAALAGLESGSKIAAVAGATLPYAGLLTAAANTASNLGRAQLRRYARPDFVLSKDVFFRLSPALQYTKDGDTSHSSQGDTSSEPDEDCTSTQQASSFHTGHSNDSYLRVS